MTEAEAARKAEADRAYSASQLRRAENRRQVQGGVRAVTLTGLGLRYADREKLLAGLFRELDDIDAYDADPARRMRRRHLLRLGIDTDELPKHAASHLARKDEMATLARTHLEPLRTRHIVDLDDEPGPDAAAAPVPPAQAQGPPH